YSMSVNIDGGVHAAYQDPTLWAEPYHTQVAPLYDEYPGMLERLVATARKRHLEQVIRPHRGTSATFAARRSDTFQSRLLFLDGDHSYEAVKADIACLAPFLVSGGWICFDDAFSTYEGVDRAITELVIESPDYDVKRQMTRKCFAA